MKAGKLVMIDYGEAGGFKGPFVLLGPTKANSEWMKAFSPDGRLIEVHVDYIYPMKGNA